MVKKTPETLLAIVETMASGILSQSAAARINNVSPSSFWSYIAQSQKGEPGFEIEFLGERMPFHQAVILARKCAVADIEGRFLQRAHYGHDEPIFFQGRPQWKEREDLAGLDDEMVAILGYPDRFERDVFGRRIQLVVHHEPPVAAVIKILESHLPKLYGERKEVNINQNNSGVTVVRHQHETVKPLAQPAPVEAIPYEPSLEDILGDGPSPIEDAEPVDATEHTEPAPEPEMVSEPEPVTDSTAPEPEEYARKSSAPLSPLQRELLANWSATKRKNEQ